jgi:uncharacterized membrane protein
MDSDSRSGAAGSPTGGPLPADLAAVVLLTLLALGSVLLPGVRETPLRVVVGLPLVLFLPGYALVAALFPEASPETGGDGSPSPTVLYPGDVESADLDDRTTPRGITVVERVGLSFAASLLLAAAVGLLLNNTPLGLRLVPIVGSLAVVVVGLVAIAVRRRLALAAETRFRVRWRDRLAGFRSEVFLPEGRIDAKLNVTLAISLIVAASAVGYAVAVPTEGQSYTELYLLSESDGELVADGYPTEFTAGEPRPLVVGVGNREHEPVTYTVVVEAHRVSLEDGSTRVLETEPLDRFQQRLSTNETWHHRHSVAPTMVGDRVRLTYLLYRGSPPSEPTVDNAYRKLHLWVNVTAE